MEVMMCKVCYADEAAVIISWLIRRGARGGGGVRRSSARATRFLSAKLDHFY